MAIKNLTEIPPEARALTSIGDQTTVSVAKWLAKIQQPALFPALSKARIDYEGLASAFKKKEWIDAECTKIVEAISKSPQSNDELFIQKVTRWILAHNNKEPAKSIIECMDLVPPEQIEILKILSRKGSQKIVFLASWRFRQQDVVLKKIIGNPDDVSKIINRELQPHPFSMIHPNIIETHVLQNSRNEVFLVEKKLQEVLDDDWRAGGINEAANLLFDITKALRFLHDNENKIHGDVKPDNIGKRGSDYILLDFGICRPKDEFDKNSTPTGSLRTRAPELLTDQGYVDPIKADVWALGATIFNSLKGRFPLTKKKEQIPRVSTPEERKKLEQDLHQRANEWEKWVVLDDVPEKISSILAKMLEKDVTRRVDTTELIKLIQSDLAAYLRSVEKTEHRSVKFSPLEEFEQIKLYLRGPYYHLLPLSKKKSLLDRIHELKSLQGFDRMNQTEMDELSNLLS